MSQTIIAQLLSTMAQLRDPVSGCPWDIKQTFRSIAPYTIEEAYEVVEAIEQQDYDGLKDELGDLLLQVVFHAQMAQEANYFDFEAVVQGLIDKLEHRHPHIFNRAASVDIQTAEQVMAQWQAIKAKEKLFATQVQSTQITANSKGEPFKSTIMPQDLPRHLPALTKAQKIQQAAARVGFDWPEVEPVMGKVVEELAEIKAARFESHDRVFEEVGDLLFACVNLARYLDVDAEMALRQANQKFINRFESMEQLAQQQNENFEQLTLEEMEAYWQQSKQLEKAAVTPAHTALRK